MSRVKCIIAAISVAVITGCVSEEVGQRTANPLTWISSGDVTQIEKRTPQEIVTSGYALAGVGMTVAGAVMLAVPGLRQWGATVALTGIGIATLAIAFGHPLVPLTSFLLLLVLAGWKIYRRYRKTKTIV